MKTIIISFLLIFSSIALAKKVSDFESFNESLADSIDSVIEHNPEIYEKEKVKGRAPASADTVSEKLDTFDKQAVGQDSW